MLRATSHAHHSHAKPVGTVRLEAGDRHLRRKRITTVEGMSVMVDLPEPVLFADGDLLVLEDGATVRIEAAEEALYEVLPGSRAPLRHLAWHLGNRHLAAQIDETRILIRRDHVIRAMLEGLGAEVREVTEPFQPVHGAYHGAGHGHDGGHAHHEHD